MADSVEEEEFADDEGLDKHDRARSDDGKKTDDVEDSDDVKNDISWSSQGSLEAAHCD